MDPKFVDECFDYLVENIGEEAYEEDALYAVIGMPGMAANIIRVSDVHRLIAFIIKQDTENGTYNHRKHRLLINAIDKNKPTAAVIAHDYSVHFYHNKRKPLKVIGMGYKDLKKAYNRPSSSRTLRKDSSSQKIKRKKNKSARSLQDK